MINLREAVHKLLMRHADKLSMEETRTLGLDIMAAIETQRQPFVSQDARKDALLDVEAEICQYMDTSLGVPQWLETCHAALTTTSRDDNRWMPIDSAPRDGTNIMVYYEAATIEFSHIAWWNNDEHDLWESQGFDNKNEVVGWWYYRSTCGQEKLEDYKTPTHWMPLPSVFKDVY